MKFSLVKLNEYKLLYKYNFSNLNDLYNYLKSNPEVNTRIFKKQASLKENNDFSGV